jgi:hypothetical protein
MDQLRPRLPFCSIFYVCKFLDLHVLIRFTLIGLSEPRSHRDGKNRTLIGLVIPQMARLDLGW